MSILPPYQRIVRAAKQRRGIRLSADDVYSLSCDDAIYVRASYDDYPDDEDTDRAIDMARTNQPNEVKP